MTEKIDILLVDDEPGVIRLLQRMLECSDSGSDCVVIIGANITDRLLLETQLAQENRSESLHSKTAASYAVTISAS